MRECKEELKSSLRKRESKLQVPRQSKGIFAFASRSIKAKSSMGPLKEGKHFYDGPKKMADILNAQYESAFFKPLDSYD